MSRFAKTFHLMCAIVASFTCVAWWIMVSLLVFYGRTMTPRLDPIKVVLFLIPSLVVGAGALMEFSFYIEERKAKALHENGSLVTSGSDAASTGLVMITTRPRALAAIAFTLWIVIQGLRSLLSMRPYSVIWLYSGLLPHWAVLVTTSAFYGALVWIAVNIALAPSRKEEKALAFTLFAVPLLAPLGVVLPKATSSLRFLQTLLELTALLASVSILLALHKVREEKPCQEDRS
jgi:hypothetical protein